MGEKRALSFLLVLFVPSVSPLPRPLFSALVAPADVLMQPPHFFAVLLEHRGHDVADGDHPQERPPLDDGDVADVVFDHQAHDVDDGGLGLFLRFGFGWYGGRRSACFRCA